MQQQINLYAYLPQTKKARLTFKSLLIIFAGFIVILIIAHFNETRVKKQLTTQLKEINERLVYGQQSLDTTASSFPSLSVTELGQAVEKMQASLGSRSNIVKSLTRNIQFSEYLSSFSRGIAPGTWLTEIIISDGGDKIELRGKALQVTQIHQLAEQLNHLPFFVGKTFEVREMLHESPAVENQQGYLSFYIITKDNRQ